MNYNINRLTLNSQFYLFLLLFQLGNAADDTESWNSIGFETELPYSLKLELEQSLRLEDQVSSYKQTFTEASISYDMNGIKLFIPFRYAIFQDKIKKRISIGGSYKYNFKSVSIKYRSKFQRTFEGSHISDDITRNKFTLEYKINKKIKPYISGEISHLLNYNKYQYDAYRLSFGVNVDLPRKKRVKIFYLFKLEDITRSAQDKINVIGVAYNIKW